MGAIVDRARHHSVEPTVDMDADDWLKLEWWLRLQDGDHCTRVGSYVLSEVGDDELELLCDMARWCGGPLLPVFEEEIAARNDIRGINQSRRFTFGV